MPTRTALRNALTIFRVPQILMLILEFKKGEIYQLLPTRDVKWKRVSIACR